MVKPFEKHSRQSFPVSDGTITVKANDRVCELHDPEFIIISEQ